MMFRHLRILHLAACGAVFLATGAFAPGQEKTDSQSRRTVTTTEWPSLRGVLAIEDVRQLLNLNDEEQEAIRRFVRDERPRRGGRDDDPDSPPPPPAAPAWQAALYRQERRLKRILGDERYQRIRQLQAQAGGLPAAFTRDDPSQQLGVTAEQRSQARKEIRAAAEKMNDRFQAVPRNRYEEQARLRTELYDSLTPQLTALLTEAQTEKWAEITGEPGDATLILKIRTLGGR
jgi:hypothetical protein